MGRDTRNKMLDTAIELFRRHGYNGTGFRQVVAESGAPRGSMYHHFPGGKAQLGTEAVTRAGELTADLMNKVLGGDDAIAGFRKVWSLWIDYVESGGFAGCPVLAVAVETHPEAPELPAAAAAAFESWVRAYKAPLDRAGIDEEEAYNLGLLCLSAIEGATGLARARGNREPLERVVDQLAAILQERIARASHPS
jgi:AcrR family transcriptional regulator